MCHLRTPIAAALPAQTDRAGQSSCRCKPAVVIRLLLLKWPQSHYASAAAAVADDHKLNLALVAAVPLQMHQQPGSFTLHCWCMHLMAAFASWCFGSCLSSCLLLIS